MDIHQTIRIFEQPLSVNNQGMYLQVNDFILYVIWSKITVIFVVALMMTDKKNNKWVVSFNGTLHVCTFGQPCVYLWTK